MPETQLPIPVAAEIMTYYSDSLKLRRLQATARPALTELESLVMQVSGIKPSQLLQVKKLLDQLNHAIS